MVHPAEVSQCCLQVVSRSPAVTSEPATDSGAQQPKARVFISYSRKDMAFADRLEAALEARGLRPWHVAYLRGDALVHLLHK
jgi:hypothetical protein